MCRDIAHRNVGLGQPMIGPDIRHYYNTNAMQELEHLYCDNVNAQASSLREALFPFLSAANAVLEDVLHIIMRYTRTVPDGHPLKGVNGCGRVSV